MKPSEGESYESWAERVRMFEHGSALQEIAQGKDINEVLERMSRRIMDKLLHPIYKEINASNKTIDLEESKRSYEEKYLKLHGSVADHVEGQTFDNTE
jgi:glutamyl-tRNA reductase